MMLYASRPVTAEVEEFNIWGQKRYAVRRSDGTTEWLTEAELNRKYTPVNGNGWPSVTRREENQ